MQKAILRSIIEYDRNYIHDQKRKMFREINAEHYGLKSNDARIVAKVR